MIKVVQIACGLLLIAVLYGFGSVFTSMSKALGVGFPVGFVCGAGLFAVVWLINERMDKSSASRHSSSEKD